MGQKFPQYGWPMGWHHGPHGHRCHTHALLWCHGVTVPYCVCISGQVLSQSPRLVQCGPSFDDQGSQHLPSLPGGGARVWGPGRLETAQSLSGHLCVGLEQETATWEPHPQFLLLSGARPGHCLENPCGHPGTTPRTTLLCWPVEDTIETAGTGHLPTHTLAASLVALGVPGHHIPLYLCSSGSCPG